MLDITRRAAVFGHKGRRGRHVLADLIPAQVDCDGEPRWLVKSRQMTGCADHTGGCSAP